jgi:gamma-glutamyltranspeptidase/glutathione hydrolase
MACTSDPRATQVALDILKSGGNAIDAAIAANAMLGVVEPMSNGIGGDLFAIVWDAKTEQLYGLNASGRSPQSLSIETVREAVAKTEGGVEIPMFDPIAWSVPGCVSGWKMLHDQFGTASIEDVLSPSIRTASEGFPVAPIISGHWQSALTRITPQSDTAGVFLLDGNRVPAEGELFRNPVLANTYQRLVDHGLSDFYTGQIAAELAKFSRTNGGYLTAEDLKSHEANWVDPVSVRYRGYDVWELPPNGQGIAALSMLSILSNYDISSMGWGSPEYLHVWTEAKKLAFADRARYYADMSMSDVPVEQLISSKYGKQQSNRIDLKSAATQLEPGDPKLVNGDTIYLTVVDKDRNCISLIQSNYYGFGSGYVPLTLGFAIQNRGSLFTLENGHPNQYAPGKRPFHTIIPAMVTQDNRPVLSFGVMGGDMQPQGHTQVLCNWIDFGMNIQMAGDAARVRHDGSATPTGLPMEETGGTLCYEQGIPTATLESLESLGHVVQPRRTGMGGYQAIEIDWDRGVLSGATESRTDGFAAGY